MGIGYTLVAGQEQLHKSHQLWTYNILIPQAMSYNIETFHGIWKINGDKLYWLKHVLTF